MKKIFKKFFTVLLDILVLLGLGYIAYDISKQFVEIHTPDVSNLFTTVNIIENKEVHYIILDKYIYDTNSKLVEYKKKNGHLVKETKTNLEFKRKYDVIKKEDKKEQVKKEDMLYDFLVINGKTLDLRIDRLNYGTNDFLERLAKISVAPYYDQDNNTLYVLAHSSGKPILNLGKIFYHMKLGDIVTAYDIQNTQNYITDKFKVINILKVPKKKFADELFLSWKNKIVLVTCYPLNDNSKRLIVVLSKIDDKTDNKK